VKRRARKEGKGENYGPSNKNVCAKGKKTHRIDFTSKETKKGEGRGYVIKVGKCPADSGDEDTKNEEESGARIEVAWEKIGEKTLVAVGGRFINGRAGWEKRGDLSGERLQGGRGVLNSSGLSITGGGKSWRELLGVPGKGKGVAWQRDGDRRSDLPGGKGAGD